MNEKEAAILSRCFLFAGCEADAVPLVKKCCGYEIAFPCEARIPFRDERGGRLGILLEGKASVFSAEDERTLLNRLEAGSLFGVSSLYSEKEADTIVCAALPTRILFLDEEDLGPLWEHPKARENLISFLTGRIRFLTEKIASFTAPCAENKLARFLLQKADLTGGIPPFRSYSELAKILNLGRASLYRALEKLEEEGIISRCGKEITLLDQEKLKLFLSR